MYSPDAGTRYRASVIHPSLFCMNRYEHHSDNELVTLLINGDEKAFEAIYKRYAKELYAYARRNVSMAEECEEIIQEIFESLWKRHADLHHVTALNAYLYQMVKYKIIHHFRREKVKAKYAEHFRLFESIYDSLPGEERDPEVIKQLIEQSINELPQRCQEAVSLRLNENLSNSDIALRMNIKKTTVENYMITAFSHFRQRYQKIYNAI